MSDYPVGDNQFEEQLITGVSNNGNDFTMADGFSFGTPKDSPVKPKKGMLVRTYGKGIGSRVRGLFFDGVRIYYRTEEEDRKQFESEMYGDDAKEWLRRWDANETVWTIEMGGMGPGYEQVIHICCAEVLRYLLNGGSTERKAIEDFSFKNPVIKELGLSGAQWGAAVNIAGHLFRHGPIGVMKDEAVKDRHIQVQRLFPQPVAA